MFGIHKTSPSKYLSEQCRKSCHNRAYSSSFGFWHNRVAIQSFYTKVSTVERAGTYDSCFGQVIADVKKNIRSNILKMATAYFEFEEPLVCMVRPSPTAPLIHNVLCTFKYIPRNADHMLYSVMFAWQACNTATRSGYTREDKHKQQA